MPRVTLFQNHELKCYLNSSDKWRLFIRLDLLPKLVYVSPHEATEITWWETEVDRKIWSFLITWVNLEVMISCVMITLSWRRSLSYGNLRHERVNYINRRKKNLVLKFWTASCYEIWLTRNAVALELTAKFSYCPSMLKKVIWHQSRKKNLDSSKNLRQCKQDVNWMESK